MGELIFERRLPAPTGVLLIRDIPRGLSDTTSLVLGLMQRQDLACDQNFTVLTRERIRQRPPLRRVLPCRRLPHRRHYPFDRFTRAPCFLAAGFRCAIA